FRLGVEVPEAVAASVSQLSDGIVVLQQGSKQTWLQEQDGFPLAGCIDSSAQYGDFYLRDLVNATLYMPAATGWAKSLEKDVFDYGQQALLGAALWNRDWFVKE